VSLNVYDLPSKHPYWTVELFAIDLLIDAHSLPTILLIIQLWGGTMSHEDVGSRCLSAQLAEVTLFILFKEGDVLHLELDCLFCIVPRTLHSVFAHSQEVVEGN